MLYLPGARMEQQGSTMKRMSFLRMRKFGLAVVVFAAPGALGFQGFHRHPGRSIRSFRPSTTLRVNPCSGASKDSLHVPNLIDARDRSCSGKETFCTRESFLKDLGRRCAGSAFITALVSGSFALHPTPARADATGVDTLQGVRNALVQARDQLAPIPDLIRDEKWDSVRTVLLKPPLQELWSNKKGSSVASSYVDLLGEQGGDELEAMELREALSSHLRYLDMAVYNNVFNPITSQGKTGASAELIRSYYEDPTNEYRASLSTLQELISLSDSLV